MRGGPSFSSEAQYSLAFIAVAASISARTWAVNFPQRDVNVPIDEVATSSVSNNVAHDGTPKEGGDHAQK
jgi:hypothetical protein